jgi:flagellar L-ring protein precursor FlgH
MRRHILLSACVLLVSAPASAQKAHENYDELYQRYLASARETATATPPGSAPSIGWMSGLAMDFRARSVNDLVTVRVIESIAASGTADSNLTKNSAASIGVPKILGLETKLPDAVDPTNLISANADTAFKGAGSTTRTGDLSAVLTARVVEVLPNGDLVLEGVREIDINGDRQMVILTGVVRQADISRNNVVVSTAIGQLRIRYFGRGLIKDNLRPGWLIRVLNKIF